MTLINFILTYYNLSGFAIRDIKVHLFTGFCLLRQNLFLIDFEFII